MMLKPYKHIISFRINCVLLSLLKSVLFLRQLDPKKSPRTSILMALFFKVSVYALYNHLAYFLLSVVPTKCFGVGVSCRNLYSFVVYLYVNGSGSITSVGEERANLSAVVYL